MIYEKEMLTVENNFEFFHIVKKHFVMWLTAF